MTLRANKLRWLHLLLAVCTVLALPVVVWASGGEPHGGGEHHAVMFWDTPEEKMKFIAACVNFVLILALVFTRIIPAISDALSRRSVQLRDALEAAERAREKAESAFAEQKRRLESIDSELSGLRAQYKEDAEREKARIDENTTKMVEKIRAEAEMAIAAEVNRARKELSHEASQLAVQIATEVLRDRITEDDRRRLNDEFVERISRVSA